MRQKVFSILALLLMATGAWAETTWEVLSVGSTTGMTLGESGTTKYYYPTTDLEFSNTNVGGSGLTIRGTVYLYIPEGVTITATGANASGATGAGAGIELAEGNTLYIIGKGKVIATGGNAANGGNGGNGGNAILEYDEKCQPGSGGNGGNGGGGAGAGIGTRGGNGGAGGAGATANRTTNEGQNLGVDGNAGSVGNTAGNMGELYVDQTGVTVTATGGSAATSGGAGGNRGKNAAEDPYNQYTASGGGGGGGGGFGGAASNIGTGGPGGGGGGGGAAGNGAVRNYDFYRVGAGGGKGGRNADGSYASDGVTSELTSMHDAELKAGFDSDDSYTDQGWESGNGMHDGGNGGGKGSDSSSGSTNSTTTTNIPPAYAPVTKYDLTLATGSDAHGTVAFTVGGSTATQAEKGDVVTVSVTPNEGYSAKDVTVRAYTSWEAANARRRSAPALVSDITVTKNEENGTWTFTMPEANVWVVVTYTKNLQDAWIQAIADQTYTGSAITPTVTVKDGETTLVLNTDYTVAYSNNVETGTATVTVTGTGNYSGTATANFTIVADKSALNTAITEAETYYNSIKDDHAEAAAALKTAIDNAKAMQEKGDATQEEVNNALSALTTAKTTAEDAVLTETKTALNNDITAAETYYNSIKDSNPTAAATLLDAINAAKTVKDNADATQEQVDAAIAALASAKTTAEQTVLTETKDELNDDITEAEAYYNSIKDSNPAAAATLLDAINAAKTVKDNTDATQEQVDTAIAALASAKTTAEQTVLTETKDELNDDITEAEAYYNSIKDSNPAAAATLLDAINAAKTVKDNADATQEQVETAAQTLTDALNAAKADVALKRITLTIPAKSYMARIDADKRQIENAVAGVKLYSVKSVTNTEVELTAELSVIAAEMPYFIYNDNDTEVEVSIIVSSNDPDNVAYDSEHFKGTLVDKTFTDEDMEEADHYVLSGGSSFVWVKDAGVLSAGKCWIELIPTSAAHARRLSIVHEGGTTTGINAVSSAAQMEGEWYDLSGRRVAQPTKGLFIVNGKKVVVK